jgi:hypothetical protein
VVFNDFNEIVWRLDGVETNLTDLKNGVCLKKGVDM